MTAIHVTAGDTLGNLSGCGDLVTRFDLPDAGVGAEENDRVLGRSVRRARDADERDGGRHGDRQGLCNGSNRATVIANPPYGSGTAAPGPPAGAGQIASRGSLARLCCRRVAGVQIVTLSRVLQP